MLFVSSGKGSWSRPKRRIHWRAGWVYHWHKQSRQWKACYESEWTLWSYTTMSGQSRWHLYSVLPSHRAWDVHNKCPFWQLSHNWLSIPGCYTKADWSLQDFGNRPWFTTGESRWTLHCKYRLCNNRIWSSIFAGYLRIRSHCPNWGEGEWRWHLHSCLCASNWRRIYTASEIWRKGGALS